MGKQGSKLQPGTIEELSKQTEFSEEEIRQWYKDFVHDFPKGYVKLDEFERMYEGFFPNGDASKFARHVFHAFDVDGDGHIDFREFVCGLNATLRGSIEQKLQWAFRVYDIHEDGYISKEEMKDIISVSSLPHTTTIGELHFCKERFEYLKTRVEPLLAYTVILLCLNCVC